ncbi:MAG: helix-turn-helix domain-containing protein [Desulfatiglandales bacterium]
MEQIDFIMTSQEVAKYLRIPIRTLYKLCQEGKIPATKVGRHWRFRKDMLDRWFDKKPSFGRMA